ncbi:MAG TPA: efflux transporter outer membrane subunit, partial [Stellaceae bacterium]
MIRLPTAQPAPLTLPAFDKRAFALATAVLLTACAVGPDYQRPPAPVPAQYKEEGWKVGEPQDADRGPWWSIYNDPVLDGLERQVDISNQNLRASEAAFRQARAIVAQARAGYYPTVGLSASAQRSGSGTGGRIVGTSTGTTGVARTGGGSGNATLYDLTASATWTLDVWGRIRRLVEADIASAQASAADLAAARLSAQAQLATAYFGLRAADEQKRILDSTVVAYTQSLQIARNQHNAGVAGLADVISAQTQLETTQAQAIAVGVQRAQFEHAIAVLTGKPPAELGIEPAQMATQVPVIPAGMPSTLLERRPDIAAAERLMASANAQIGVATAAYYPDLTLSASYGYSSFMFDNLLSAANRFWAVGPQLAETLFDGGLRGAQVEQTRAAYDQNVALYRQTVLTGFQQVEDQLAALRILAQQAEVQALAVRDANEAVRLTLNQYKAGTVPYTSVITAQAIALGNEETAVTILQGRL